MRFPWGMMLITVLALVIGQPYISSDCLKGEESFDEPTPLLLPLPRLPPDKEMRERGDGKEELGRSR